MGRTLVQLGATLQAHGRLPEARGLVGEAVAIIRNVIGSGVHEVDQGFFAHALEIYARILMLMDNNSDAIPHLEEA